MVIQRRYGVGGGRQERRPSDGGEREKDVGTNG